MSTNNKSSWDRRPSSSRTTYAAPPAKVSYATLDAPQPIHFSEEAKALTDKKALVWDLSGLGLIPDAVLLRVARGFALAEDAKSAGLPANVFRSTRKGNLPYYTVIDAATYEAELVDGAAVVKWNDHTGTRMLIGDLWDNSSDRKGNRPPYIPVDKIPEPILVALGYREDGTRRKIAFDARMFALVIQTFADTLRIKVDNREAVSENGTTVTTKDIYVAGVKDQRAQLAQRADVAVFKKSLDAQLRQPVLPDALLEKEVYV